MTERRVTVGSRVGLHARPAALFVQAASRQTVLVTVAKDGADPVDARSILSVIGLGAACGDEVILSASGEGAEAALDELAALVASDLDSEAG
jgi:phosphocarrier protein